MLKPALHVRTNGPRAIQRGFSILELLVGVAVGMVVIGGASMLFAQNLTGSRLLLAEARLNEDLRNAADLLTRDLRRAGYWGNAIKGTIAEGVGSVTPSNPYRTTSGADNTLAYTFSREAGADDDTASAEEAFGFRLNGSALEMYDGSNWVEITDKTSVTVTKFSVTPSEQQISLGDTCPTVCNIGVPGCPVATVRSYAVLLEGQSTRDANLKRSLRSTVRVRNDHVTGSCPA